MLVRFFLLLSCCHFAVSCTAKEAAAMHPTAECQFFYVISTLSPLCMQGSHFGVEACHIAVYATVKQDTG